MYGCELDYKESWVLKNWYFWTVELEKTLESPLDSKEIKPVSPKGNQPWIFTGRTNVRGEAPMLWPPALKSLVQLGSIQSLSRVWLFATPWIAACQASLSITNSWSSLRLTSIKSVKPSSHLILCCPLLLLPPVPPSIRVFSNESTLRMKWPKY